MAASVYLRSYLSTLRAIERLLMYSEFLLMCSEHLLMCTWADLGFFIP